MQHYEALHGGGGPGGERGVSGRPLRNANFNFVCLVFSLLPECLVQLRRIKQ